MTISGVDPNDAKSIPENEGPVNKMQPFRQHALPTITSIEDNFFFLFLREQ